MKGWALAAVVALALLCAVHALSGVAYEDPSALYEDAMDFVHLGRYEAALANLETLYAMSGQTPDRLIEISSWINYCRGRVHLQKAKELEAQGYKRVEGLCVYLERRRNKHVSGRP